MELANKSDLQEQNVLNTLKTSLKKMHEIFR